MSHLPTLLKIPTEINERIITMSEPTAVSAMAQSCTYFRNLIHRPLDQHIWRSLYLVKFDDPKLTLSFNNSPPTDYPWARSFQDRVRAEILLTRRSKFHTLSHTDQDFVLRMLTDAVSFSPIAASLTSSQDLQWVKRLIVAGEVFKDFHLIPYPSQLHVRLHVYFGFTYEEGQPSVDSDARLASRTFVYDLRKYTRANLWGPFQVLSTSQVRSASQVRVDWTYLDHMINVVAMNLEDLLELRDELRPPMGLGAVTAYSAPNTDPSSHDWAGIEGKWYRYVCFMDYRDLFALNFSTPADNTPLNTSIFEDDDFQEAVRLIELDLRIVKKAADSQNPTRPILHFEGSSKNTTQQGNETRVRGTVQMTADGQVRWKYVSVYDGFTQWSSEGIQIGGVASAMGVVGTWTGARHSEHDPVGPFWLWKVENFV